MQILARYVDFIPRYIWTEEVARFCFIWIIMLGAMIAVRDDTHFDVDVLPQPRTAAAVGLDHVVLDEVGHRLARSGIGAAQPDCLGVRPNPPTPPLAPRSAPSVGSRNR